MDQRLPEAQRYWDLHARRDPLWAVLSDEAKKDRGWTLDAFMATGEREISLLFYQLRELGIVVRKGRALDFGCGVGRLAQAMARRFDAVVGLDISPRMVQIARQLNKCPERVEYIIHDSPDLSIFTDPFDFIYSNVVLQHIPADLAAAYLRAFCGVLSAEGLLVFQLPSHRTEGGRSASHPMADAAYRASISLASEEPMELPPCTEFALVVRIRNAGDGAWSQNDVGPIRVGNHWLSLAGEMLVQDDGRAPLPPSLAPDEQHVTEIVVKTPSAGRYILELDIVHEVVTWFGDRGSLTLRIPVTVGQVTTSDPPGDAVGADIRHDERGVLDGLEPLGDVPAPEPFPMNAIERDEVARIIHDAGGRIERVEEDDRARPEWSGYKYFVSRSR